MLHLFKTKASSKLKSLLSKLERDRSSFERNSASKEYLDREDLRKLKEKSMRDLEEAESKGCDFTTHGSVKKVRAKIKIYEQWEKIGFYPGVFFDFYDRRVDNDQTIANIDQEEEKKSIEEFKENVRKYGRGKGTLLQIEQFDLDWLLEVEEKNLGLPEFVQVEHTNGSFEVVSPHEWITRLKNERDRICDEEKKLNG